jgi:hypothetical protein
MAALNAELRRRVERTLMPGVKADRKIEALYEGAAPWPRLFEAVPPLALALLVFWKTRSFAFVWPCYAYIGYLLLDLLLVPQRRLTKWIRNGSAVAFTFVYGGSMLARLGLPPVPGGDALLAILAGATFPYLYERGRVALGYLQGLVLCALLELGALFFSPTGLGPHAALPLCAAVYAWERRTVFWRYAVPVLAAYAFFVPWWMGGGTELVAHVLAGLLAWMLVRLLSGGSSPGEAREGTPAVGSASQLGLFDEGSPPPTATGEEAGRETSGRAARRGDVRPPSGGLGLFDP